MGLLPSTEIASLCSQRQCGFSEIPSSHELLEIAERYAEYCFGLERMLQPTQLCSQRQCGFSEILRCPFAALRMTEGEGLAMAEGGSK